MGGMRKRKLILFMVAGISQLILACSPGKASVTPDIRVNPSTPGIQTPAIITRTMEPPANAAPQTIAQVLFCKIGQDLLDL
jgi:hypothetical protein